jgi:hypothetical protein
MEQAVESNRYLIYRLLRHRVKVEATGFGKQVKPFMGAVEQVTRDVFENRIVLTVSGQKYAYDEPTVIVERGNCIVFVYGDLEDFDDSDEALFRDMRASAYGENINDIISRSGPSRMRSISFEIGEQVISKPLWGRRG